MTWHYITESQRGLGFFDPTRADVDHLHVVQSRHEDAAVRPPEAFVLKYIRGIRHRLNLGPHIIR